MKTSVLVVIVVALHCAAIGSLFFIQGCGTTSTTGTPPPTPVMPPPGAPEAGPAIAKPAVVPKPVEKAKPAETTIYVVQSGDSISKIAKRFNIRQAEIVELNKLANPNKIRIGQKLLLPGYVDVIKPAPKRPKKTSAVKPAPVTSPVFIQPVEGAANEYMVQAGDSLSKIAARFGTKVSALREANKLQSDKILVGQKLVIPSSEAVAPSVEESAGSVVSVGDQESDTAEAGLKPVSSTTIIGIIHVVQPGESLGSVAKLYAVTVDELVEINQLSPTAKIKSGQRLNIP